MAKPDKPPLAVMRVSLTPKITRDVAIALDTSLYDFAEAIVKSFGFDFDHAFGFYSKLTGAYHDSPVQYELFADIEDTKGDTDALGVNGHTIADAFPKEGHKMRFLFDYGDDWMFTIERRAPAEREKGKRYPRTVASQGKAPKQYP